MRVRLAAVPAEEKATWSRAIRGHLLGFAPLHQATTLLIFSSLADEPSTEGWLEAWAAPGRTLALPRIAEDGRLALHAVRQPGHLIPGPFDIAEPDPRLCPEIDPQEVDGTLVPGLAFDRQGQRLGRGKGYYDRLLARLRPNALACGVFFSLQEVPTVPTFGHDRPLHAVLTEKGSQAVA
jgi:5-formyltetrahydrofolate cyclo-ligase